VCVVTGCDVPVLEGAPLDWETTGLLVGGGAGEGAATGAGGGLEATPAPELGGPLAAAPFLGFGLTWTVRCITCVFTFGFGFWVRAACVWVAVPVLEFSAYPPSAPSPATLASAAIFILKLVTSSSPPREVVWTSCDQSESRPAMGRQAPG
jgi:hypothetical protein